MDITGLAEALTHALGTFEPDAYSVPECARLAEQLASTGKACGAASTLAASRAAASGAHRDAGFSDPSSWVAHQAGTTTRQAKEALETAKRLGRLSATREALLAGEISLGEAHEIARAEQDSPGQEQALLGAARDGDLTTLRDEVRERKLASTPVERLHEEQLSARRFRSWRDKLGMVRIDAALPPETGIPLVNRVETLARRLWRKRGHEGGRERFEQFAADALVAVTTGGGGDVVSGNPGADPGDGPGPGTGPDPDESSSAGAGTGDHTGDEDTPAEEDRPPVQATGGSTERRPARRPTTELVIVCDLYAWRRGHTHDGEPCHIIGGGPIPVDLARELSTDAFLKAVLHDGKEIRIVSHPGRRYTVHLRTALDLGPVPAFTGRACADCGRRYGLENDHVDPVAHTGPTSFDNIQPRCYPCHAQKTERDRKAGLLGARAKARGPATWPSASRSRSPARGSSRRAPPDDSAP